MMRLAGEVPRERRKGGGDFDKNTADEDLAFVREKTRDILQRRDFG